MAGLIPRRLQRSVELRETIAEVKTKYSKSEMMALQALYSKTSEANAAENNENRLALAQEGVATAKSDISDARQLDKEEKELAREEAREERAKANREKNYDKYISCIYAKDFEYICATRHRSVHLGICVQSYHCKCAKRYGFEELPDKGWSCEDF